VKWELERRLPARYTASNSPRRTSRASRGNVFPSAPEPAGVNGLPGLFGGEPMASLLAARRQHPAATLRLHACAESVRLGAPTFARLKCALWQAIPLGNTRSQPDLHHLRARLSPLVSSAAGFEFNSVFDPRAQGQETIGVAYRAGKSDTPIEMHTFAMQRR
jgi:hypothetical protein